MGTASQLLQTCRAEVDGVFRVLTGIGILEERVYKAEETEHVGRGQNDLPARGKVSLRRLKKQPGIGEMLDQFASHDGVEPAIEPNVFRISHVEIVEAERSEFFDTLAIQVNSNDCRELLTQSSVQPVRSAGLGHVSAAPQV